MKTALEWMENAELALPLDTKLSEDIVHAIQHDALRHAAQLVHDMSRGTTSEDRAIAIDEARDLIENEARSLLTESVI